MNTLIIILAILLVVILVFLKVNKTRVKDRSDKKIKGTIFYHEDDYGQIEIVPKENFGRLIKEAENVKYFSENHFESEGFTDMYVRNGIGLKLEERKIKASELNEILLKVFEEKHTNVTTGISSDEIRSKNTYGYGKNHNGIFFDFNEGFVLNIWISGRIDVNNHKLTSVLNEIGRKWNLLLMDWNTMELIDLTNSEQTSEYLV